MKEADDILQIMSVGREGKMKILYNNVEAYFMKEKADIDRRLQDALKKNESIMRKKNEYEYIYNFSHNRGNIALWLDLPKDSKILEVGGAEGGLTRCLTKRYPNVTVLEQDDSLALQNMTKIHENEFILYCGKYEETIPLLRENEYDCIIVNTVDVPFHEHKNLLSQLYHKLNLQGQLLYGIDNKYAPVSWIHTEVQICNMAMKNSSLQVLKDAGFTTIYEYFPLPNSIFTMEIYKKDYLEKNGVDAGMYQLYNMKLELNHVKKMLEECQKDGKLPECMPTFLFVAEKGGENV